MYKTTKTILPTKHFSRRFLYSSTISYNYSYVQCLVPTLWRRSTWLELVSRRHKKIHHRWYKGRG